MHVLHLIDAAGPQATPTTLALLSASLDRLGHIGQRVMLLGGAGLRRSARQAGIDNAQSMPVIAGKAWLSGSAGRRAIADMGRFDLIHCWSIGALSMAAMHLRGTPRLLTVTVQPPRHAAHWLRMIQTYAPGQTIVLPISNTIRRDLIRGGVAEQAIHVVRPALDMARIEFADRRTLRDRWGAPDDETKIVALLGDPPHDPDALRAMMVVNFASDSRAESPYPVRLLMHPDQRHRRRAREMAENLGHRDRYLIDAHIACPWRVLPGCDLALAIGKNAGGLSLLWAMAANIPIVADASYAVSEIVEDRHSALLCKPDHPPAAAHRIRRLIDDPQLAWQLRDTARHEAYSFFSRQHYCHCLGIVYEQLAGGQPINVPPLEPTGGLRFTGRA